MIFIVNAENRSLFDADIVEMHRQRKAVFVDEAGWNVPVVEGLEMDRYDRRDTTYLIAKPAFDSARVLASLRLLPTIAPHLMSDLFVNACRGPAPRGPGVWEVSRFCVTREVGPRARLALLWEMVCAVIETALIFCVEQVIFVANAGLLPLVLNCGWNAARLGPTLPDGHDEMTAMVAAITPAALRNVRSRFGIAGPVTRFAIPSARIAA